MILKSLEIVLAYHNDWVLKRFKKTCYWFNGTEEEAVLIFEDLKRFLWLYAKIEQQRLTDPKLGLPDISIATNMEIIDEMWHSFILYTQFYSEFCEEHFGLYLHHPVPMEKFINNTKIHGNDKASEIFISEMIECVCEEFGEEVAIRWFDTYEKFNSPIKAPENHSTV